MHFIAYYQKESYEYIRSKHGMWHAWLRWAEKTAALNGISVIYAALLGLMLIYCVRGVTAEEVLHLLNMGL